MYWTVDPIDGTSPCAAGYKSNWNVALGLVINGVPVLGIVGLPSEGKVIVGGPLIGEVYMLDLSGHKEQIKRVDNKNTLWGMDMAPGVAQDPFLV
ncbi:inositol monophosphatase family protein, partial [Staphylococcus aureus]